MYQFLSLNLMAQSDSHADADSQIEFEQTIIDSDAAQAESTEAKENAEYNKQI